MAAIEGTSGAPFEERTMFVRKATGLVRGWAVRDAFIYATFAINLVTLGWYIFAFAPATIPNGNLLWALLDLPSDHLRSADRRDAPSWG